MLRRPQQIRDSAESSRRAPTKEIGSIRTRLSLYYLVSYTFGGGAALFVTPQLAADLLFARGEYSDLMLPLMGMFLVGLSIIIAQIIRARSEQFYGTTLVVRAFFLSGMAVLYVMYRDPLLLSLLGVVGLGVAMTGWYWNERGMAHPQPA